MLSAKAVVEVAEMVELLAVAGAVVVTLADQVMVEFVVKFDGAVSESIVGFNGVEGWVAIVDEVTDKSAV